MRILVLLVLAMAVLCGPAPEKAYGTEYYNTNEYNVTVDVAEDNSFFITEEIKVSFTEPRHGLYRYIPLSGTAYSQVDGNLVEQTYKMKVDQVGVEGFDLQTYQENGNLVLQIGSGDYTVSGDQRYVVSYRVRLYDDGIDGYDSLYYNVIPFGWGTGIGSSTIQISMPKEFDTSKVEFLAGGYGATDQGSLQWQSSGNVISASTLRPLVLGEGVTFRAVLPEGYFQGEMNTGWAMALLIFLCIGAPLASFALWLFFGRDPKVVKTVEFYPPEGISPAEVGYIIDGTVDHKDLVSLVIHFAEKGYLSIEEMEDGEYLLMKKKEMGEEAKVYEATFFDGLFHDRDSVTLADLKEDFYASFQASSLQLKAHFKKDRENRIFTQSSMGARGLGILLMLTPIAAVIFLGPTYAMMGPELSFIGFPILMVTLLGYGIAISGHDKRDAASSAKYKGKLVAGGIIAIVGLLALGVFTIVVLGVIPGVLASVASVISFVFALRMKQRTKRSAELLGKILGFKEFIRTAELDRIRKLAEENPSYFYYVLPYAYVLGLEEKWAKSFEGIAVEPPSWYGGSYRGSMFNTWMFMNMFHGFTNSMASSIVTPQAGGGSGGLGGGGFSGGGGFGGGGFGGGGGGSW